MKNTFTYFFIAAGASMIVALILNAMEVHTRATECADKNGVLVKTYVGYRCIEAKEIP